MALVEEKKKEGMSRKPRQKYKNSFRKHAGVDVPGMMWNKLDKVLVHEVIERKSKMSEK